MRKENVRCPMCGTMNYDVDLDATDGWTKCRLCKAVTCSMDEWKKHTVSVPLLNEKQLVARSMIRKSYTLHSDKSAKRRNSDVW